MTGSLQTPGERCPRCGQANTAEARFCNACGQQLGTITAREERKIVTVLFVDLVGFTARADHLDPEDVRAILSPYYARLRNEIESFGGTVEKFIGDAVVGVFGAPVAHGDDPERAVRAALSVRSAIAEMNAGDERLDLQVRLAVNTGEAIVSLDARPELGEGMVAGDVINTASRLQSSAPTDGILVGESTYRATRSLVEYREVEPMTVKGKESPVRGWLAMSMHAGPGERSVAAVPLVGRVRESAILQRLFDGVIAEQRPHLVTVFGEAGVGKTRLAAEFTDEREAAGFQVLRGRSLPYGEKTMHGPFTQQVKQFAGIFASDDVQAARDKLHAAVELLGVGDGADQLVAHLALFIGLGRDDEVADRQVLFFATRQFVEAVARNRPTIFVFEDLHWADSGTFDLLEVLASRIRHSPVMLLALARPDVLLAHPGWGGGLPSYSALSLEALSPDDSRQLAALLLRSDPSSSNARHVAEKAEGNPLFIEELAASVAEVAAVATENLPTTIRELVSARIDALPATERRVLLAAAAVGKIFWRGALQRLENDWDGLSDSLDALESYDLIRRESSSWIEGDEQFTFKHVLIREVAYATLPRASRRERHAAVAEFLEAATRGAGATATALAVHWREAGETDRAVTYFLKAADQAGRGWAKDEAAALYKDALELIPKDDVDQRRDISRRRTLALVAASHIADAQNLRLGADPRGDH
ncbi:MAG: adenylate/guanylate cyclase domain-containing protein [Candidatus Dormiibacterota bacterium]